MGNRKYRIFLVDDDAFFLEMLTDVLSENENFILHKFLSGEHCIDYLYMQPDIVILDHDFGKIKSSILSGLEILGKIREEKPDTKVIMLTGQEDGNLVFEFIQKGADEYVIKDEEAMDNIQRIIKEITETFQ